MREIKKSPGARSLLQLLAIALLLALLASMLITELTRAKGTHSFETARLVTYTKTDALAGYIFCNETALRSNNNGPITYYAKDGDTLYADSVVAEVYIDDTATDKREQAAALQAKIDACRAALAVTERPWQNGYATDYAALMRSLGSSSLSAAVQSADSVATSLTVRDAALPETANALRVEIDTLQAQLDELVAYVDAPQVIPVDADGYFYRHVDGYEALFGPSAAVGLSPEGLDALLAAPTDTTDCIGKLVRGGAWYLALPVERAVADTYTVGSTYTVRFESVPMVRLVLEGITPSEDGTRALLLLSGDKLPAALGACRRQYVQVEKETYSGLSVPAKAVGADNSVFVIENGIARKRLLAPVHEDAPFLSRPGSEAAYLKEGERILLSTRSLYDGKVLE